MKVLLDTSVLVAAMIAKHPRHIEAKFWLEKAHQRKFNWFISGHSLVELYSVLTRLPLEPKISPFIAHQLIETNILGKAKIITLNASDFPVFIEHVQQMRWSGGIIYDALIAFVASKHKVEQLVTLNEKDFQKVCSSEIKVVAVKV